MAHPVLWPKKSFFYPIGNTAPACFTRELPPETAADILLLGCGDPRSILYTIYSDHGLLGRKLDFTCCDAEPAILARNILLLTMIADGENSLVIWSIFYHFFLDDASLGILLAQCRKLVQFSNDMQTWSASKYGRFLRFCTEHSLAEIQRHWTLYLEMETMPAPEKALLRNRFTSGMNAAKSKTSGLHSAINAAGPFSSEILGLAPKHFEAFWSTGVTVGVSAQSKSYPHLNPTFVYSTAGTKFNVHYGTDPIVSFHLAPILTSIKNAQTPSTIGIKDLVEGARQQFFSLCSSLKSRLALEPSANLTIRFFVGDALAFCRALHYCGDANLTETGIYTYPWGGTQIDFNVQDYTQTFTRKAPLTFNVIDTSNLTDHLGLMNILLLTVPLLLRHPSSTIYTDTLLNTDASDSGLSTKVCADIPTLALFLGIAPLSYLSHFTSHSDKHGMMFSAITDSQFPQSISWKFSFTAIAGATHDMQISNTVVRLVCDAGQVAKFLFSVYYNMFAVEDVRQMFKRFQISIHYTRCSFITFLGFVKAKVSTSWVQIMDSFFSLVESDTSLMIGLHHYQDLICQLHLRNLLTITMDTLQPTFLEGLRSSRDRFHGWKDIPPVVCVILKVPRRCIKILEDMDSDKILTPSIECHTKGPNFDNIHPSLQLLFGDIQGSVSVGEPAIKILGDRKGWKGRSDLIVTFYMPSWILLQPTVSVSLHVHPTPVVAPSLRAKLDMFLTIYSTTVMDTEHLQFARERPGNVGELNRLHTIAAVPKSSSKNATEVQTTVGFDKSGVIASTLTMRHVITTPDAQKSLSNMASVTTRPVSDSGMQVTFDGYKHLFINPLPVRGSQSKTRIARKSSYIEVETPLRSDYENFLDLSLNPFPISREGQNFNLLNIHYLNLNQLPALKLPAKHEKLQWMSTHLGLTLSKNERILKEQSEQNDRGTIVNLKESIAAVFIKWAGLEKNLKEKQPRFPPLGLYDPAPGIGNYTLIFVNDIRLDLASHTIVADACVIPLSEKNMDKLFPALRKVSGLGLVQIVTLDDETRLWKLLLPALAERCRTWKHLPTCEYLIKGIPACMEGFGESPLCSCGKGKDLGNFGTKSEWKGFHSEATRIALSPLFSSSSVENTMTSMKADAEEASMPSSSSILRSLSPSTSLTQCANCSGPGQPTLLACSACKQTKYCSRTCQKSHWKTHKLQCSKASSS